jgi:hypothetical protein
MNIDELAVLVDALPNAPTLTLNRDDNFVDKSRITAWTKISVDVMGVLGPERSALLTNCFVKMR